jgi:hypothetical protein
MQLRRAGVMPLRVSVPDAPNPGAAGIADGSSQGAPFNPAARAHGAIGWIEIALATLCGMAGGTLWAVLLGQDINWDQRNYHVYIVYAWLHQRFWFDLDPAQIQNWFNPLGHLPAYLAITRLPPVLTGAVLGAVAGINAGLVYWLARLLTRHDEPVVSRAVAALAATVGVTSGTVLTILGTTHLDDVLTIAVLAALVMLCTAHGAPPGAWRARSAGLPAGVLVGLAIGIKLTMLIALAALVPALALVTRGRDRVLTPAALLAGAAIGFLVTGGFWAWTLWHEYGSPLFPYYNGIFRSPWYPPVNLFDGRYVPKSLLEALLYPFYNLTLWRFPNAEVWFREPRFALLTVMLACCAALSAWRVLSARNWLPAVLAHPRWAVAAPVGVLLFFVAEYGLLLDQFGLRRATVPLELAALAGLAGVTWRHLRLVQSSSAPRPFPGGAQGVLVLAFAVGAYVIWIRQFAITRYAVVVDMLSGIVMWLLLRQMGIPARRALALFACMTVLLLLSTRPGSWGRQPYGADWFAVQAPPHVLRSETMHLALGGRPVSWVIPFLGAPPGPVLRLENNAAFGPYLVNQKDGPWWQLIRERVATHRGPLRTLSELRLEAPQLATLAALGLRVDDRDCVTIRSQHGELISCAVARQASTR